MEKSTNTMMNFSYLHFFQEEQLTHYLPETSMSNVWKINHHNINALGHGLHLIVDTIKLNPYA
jgi:hypothetical protein